jgi:hypothetical protein
MPELIKKLEKYTRQYYRLAQRNIVKFKMSKMEVILLLRNTKHYAEINTVKIRVGDY